MLVIINESVKGKEEERGKEDSNSYCVVSN
jgi:hypothetical protein